MSRPSVAVVLLVLLALTTVGAPTASAQVFYEPAGTAGADLRQVAHLYYSRANPLVVGPIGEPVPCEQFLHWGAKRFSGGDIAFGGHPYPDISPWITHPCRPYANAALWGVSRRDLYYPGLSQGLYFDKAGMMDSARIDAGGMVVVPFAPGAAQAHQHGAHGENSYVVPGRTLPVKKGAIIIIPMPTQQPQKQAPADSKLTVARGE